MKKLFVLNIMAVGALLVSMVGICFGTTIGFVGAAAVNADIPADYGSYCGEDGPGWTVSDGTGATPDIGLSWNSGGSDWEFHNASTFDPVEDETVGGDWDASYANAVAQLQDGTVPGHLQIDFSVGQSNKLILDSFDIGNATDQGEAPYGYNISIVKVSDSSTGWTYSTALFTAGDVEHVVANFTGDLGENYTLNFDRKPAGPPTFRTGIDNLCFSQEPKPYTTEIGFVGAAAVNANIPDNYCSNVSGDGTGWKSSGTPGVTLTWNVGGSDWEFHNSGNFTPLETNTVGGTWDADSANAVAQLQGGSEAGHLEINFSVTSSNKFVLNSFDIGNALDQTEDPYGFDISFVKSSDSSVVWTHSTPLFSAGDVEHIIANFTGEVGEHYTLNFNRRPVTGITFRTGIDNLNFGYIPVQISEPCEPTNEVFQVSVGHRGSSFFAPENTLAAFAASSNKADYVEFDVRESSDGVLIIMHDDTVDRTTDGTGSVASKTLVELKALDAGSWFSPEFTGVQIPTFEETLNDIVPSRIPLIERKTGPASKYVQILQNLNMTTSVVIQSFDWNFLDDVHSIDTNIELAALGSGNLTLTTVTNLKARGIKTVAWNYGYISKTEIDMVHCKNMKIFVWTINDCTTIQYFLGMDVDGIITDDPGLVKDLEDDSYSNFIEMEKDIISYWKFDNGPAGTEATDSIDSNNGMLMGFGTPASWTNGMVPQFDGSLYLDGVNDYVDIPNSVSLNINTNCLSMSLWVKLPKKPSEISGSYGGIFDSTGDAYVMYLDKGSEEIRFKVTDLNGNAARPGIPEVNIETASWHNIAVVFDGSAGPVAGQALIYLDGRLMDVHTGNNGTKRGLNANVKPGQLAAIGRNGTNDFYYLSFTIDDFAIWNRRLRTGEIRQIYNSGTNGIPLSQLLIPEPASLGLIAILGLAFLRRK